MNGSGKLLSAWIVLFLLGLAVAALANPALGVLMAVAGVAGAFAASIRLRTQQEATDPLEQARPEDRASLRKLQSMRDDIARIVRPAGGQPSAAVKVVGEEALQEADRIVRQAAALLGAKRELKRIEQGRYEAEREAARLEERLRSATGAERESLASALEARRDQASRYAEVSARIESIAASLDQA
ncbi:MAG: hypothetical protein WHU10_07805, partial [Fimbriimonadales bacterium]